MLKPASCSGCVLERVSRGFSEPDGQGTYGVAVVGESLGDEEYIDGLPFRPHANAGSVLEIAFRYTRVARQGFIVTNLIHCQPPRNKLIGAEYETFAIEHCRPNLESALAQLNPLKNRVILAAGSGPLKHLTGLVGKRCGVTDLRGYVLPSRYGWVVGMLHPSFLRRDAMNLLPLMKSDITKALRVANGELTNFPGGKGYIEPNYITAPSLDDVGNYYYKLKANSRLPVSVDIETANTRDFEETEYEALAQEEIRTVQFSSEIGTGMCIPFTEPYIDWIRMILALPNPKLGHNYWSFDEPRLRSLGFEIGGGIAHDTMWMFKHLQPELPRGLQSVASYGDFPFPWKHLFDKDLEWYGCADVDAPLRIIKWLIPAMKRLGVWKGYREHVYELRGVLDEAEQRGFPVNEEKRIALDLEFRSERESLEKLIETHIPEELRNVKPKRKKGDGFDYGYIREPKAIKEAKRRYIRIRDWLEARGPYELPPFRRCVIKWYGLYLREFNTSEGKVRRWCKIEVFNGSSSKQLIQYIRWKKKFLLELAEEKDKAQLLSHELREPEYEELM